jgi:predicted regulator of Ras-like GTPase activity (Roadblock/LC7/MglB family)
MQGILQAILDVTGVGAALVFDSSGSLVSHRGHAIYDQALCEQLTSSLLKAIDALQLEQEDWESVSARYADGRLLLRNLGTAGGGTHVLAVAADATLNLSFATVAIRVAANKLRRALGVVAASVPSAAPPPAAASSTLLAGSSQFAGSSSRFGGSSALPAGSSQFAGSSALPAGSSALPAGSSALPAGSSVLSAGSSALPAGSSVMPAGSSVMPAGSSVLPASSRPADSKPALAGSSSLSWSQTSSIGFSRIAVADPASSTFLSRSAKELARHVGPMAKVYVEEAVRRVSPDAPFSVSLGAKFLDDLAGQIEDNDDRTRFRQALALAMQVPPADHPQWIELVRGKVQFKPSFLAARMFVASARMEVGKRGANPELIRKYAAGLRELFAENADSSNVRQDLAKIFG